MECINIEKILEKYLFSEKERQENHYVNPFSPPFLTYSSYMYHMYKKYEGFRHPLKAIRDDTGAIEIASSQVEKDFILDRYRQLNYPEGFLSKYTSAHKLPKFGRIFPDWYETATKTAGFVHGCITHGHLSESCDKTPKNKCPLTLNFLKQSYEYLNKRTKQQVEELLTHEEVDKVLIVWECEILRQSRSTPKKEPQRHCKIATKSLFEAHSHLSFLYFFPIVE